MPFKVYLLIRLVLILITFQLVVNERVRNI